ncbi:RagB/SusD family nutrient uptake outer membrane protein [Halosquirtibacter laminarini]|uniref:RagB/SusD family nutrient uptake outer membrane protein n=1 Tax=Halosquirtibacter laminarini TaxID=3374600 RepID=A0AC61NP05_9BACT|nr:RagB/SusD family nutrient uptake outer membrane protein [Prolixibacteraceae bacterium]
MKTKLYTLMLLCMIALSSCNYLDKHPEDLKTIEMVFDDEQEVRKWLGNIYSDFPDPMNFFYGDIYLPWTQLSDEMDIPWTRYYNDINKGNWNPSSEYKADTWIRYYQNIRNGYVFLKHVHTNATMDAEEVKVMKGEVRFIIAYYHFLLFQQYGPCPIVRTIASPNSSNSELWLSRNSVDEVIDYLDKELLEVSQILPNNYTDSWMGRPTKGAALALRGRAMLYAASPLFNGNADLIKAVNPSDGKVLGSSFDKAKWQKAADASKMVIDLGLYELYRSEDNDAFLSYRDLFLKWNKEIIFGRSTSNYESFVRHASPRSQGGYNGFGITQQMVDAYGMANGKDISDPTSGYVEDGYSVVRYDFTTNDEEKSKFKSYVQKGTYNMYVGRDPRFYASVMYNGRFWPTDGEVMDFTTDGPNGNSGSHDYSPTGYTMMKFFNPDDELQGNYSVVYRPSVLFRLGEVYLNYIEALNESDPGNGDIQKYYKEIRDRVGIPAAASSLTGLSQDQVREKIRAERRVELAFEGLRYFDTRRWKIADKTTGTTIYGMNINGKTNAEFFKRSEVETRVFKNKFYLYPIPQTEIDKNPNLVQNPNW